MFINISSIFHNHMVSTSERLGSPKSLQHRLHLCRLSNIFSFRPCAAMSWVERIFDKKPKMLNQDGPQIDWIWHTFWWGVGCIPWHLIHVSETSCQLETKSRLQRHSRLSYSEGGKNGDNHNKKIRTRTATLENAAESNIILRWKESPICIHVCAGHESLTTLQNTMPFHFPLQV